jgi:hypothetical protein
MNERRMMEFAAARRSFTTAEVYEDNSDPSGEKSTEQVF